MSSNKRQFSLTPISGADINGQGRKGGKWITLDKQKRLALSADFRRQLGIHGYGSVPVYVAVDPAQMVIAIVKQDVTRTVANAASLNVNKDGYIYGRVVFDKLALSAGGAPYRFEYLGPIDHGGERWDGFRLVTDVH